MVNKIYGLLIAAAVFSMAKAACVKVACRLELQGSGNDDSDKNSFVKIVGIKVSPGFTRGLALVKFHDDCSVAETKLFDTHERPPNKAQWPATHLKAYLEGLPAGSRIAVVSRDEYTVGLEPAETTLAHMGVDLSAKAYRGSLAFVAVKGSPERTTQAMKPRHGGPAKLKDFL